MLSRHVFANMLAEQYRNISQLVATRDSQSIVTSTMLFSCAILLNSQRLRNIHVDTSVLTCVCSYALSYAVEFINGHIKAVLTTTSSRKRMFSHLNIGTNYVASFCAKWVGVFMCLRNHDDLLQKTIKLN